VVLALTSSTLAVEEVPGYKYIGSFSSGGNGIGVQSVGNYYLHHAMANWDTAFLNCKNNFGARGGHLLAMETDAETAAVSTLMESERMLQLWTSGYGFDDQTWKWANSGINVFSRPLAWVNGVMQYPFNKNARIAMTYNGVLESGWSALDKSDMLFFICETPAD